MAARGRVQVGSRWKDDEVEALERASVVIGVGLGVLPDDDGLVRRLADRLGAELGATRKVTDRGHLPRSRQIGITGRKVAPRLYLAFGVGGSSNHLAGVQRATTVVAVNVDRSAPALAACDIGLVGDRREVVGVLLERLGDGDLAEAATRPPALSGQVGGGPGGGEPRREGTSAPVDPAGRGKGWRHEGRGGAGARWAGP